MEQKNCWYNKLVLELSKDINEYFLIIIRTNYSTSPILYEITESEAKHCNQLDRELFDKYLGDLDSLECGLHIFKYLNGTLADKKLIIHYNVELFNDDVCELTLFQEYGINPYGETRKQVLQKSLKAEKIKQTLVYACFINDNDKIFKCLEKTSKAQLNKKLQYHGTPLGFCAKNNNLAAFKAIAEQGADINKISLAETPLQIAFTYSYDIVLYIYENYREQFDKEVKKHGFTIACQSTDVRLFELLKNEGCNMECAGARFPPLHNFADYNNLAGIRYFAEQGANFNVLNNYKQTALDRAKRRNNTEAVELLEQYTK